MRKLFKMFSTMALAATLTVGMPIMANATTGNYTITINDAAGSANSSVGNTYTLYKVADFNVSGGVYTNIEATSDFSSLQTSLEALNGKTTDSAEAVAFANSAADIAKDLTGTTLTVSNTDKSFRVTETGYYLIVDTAHASTNPYLTTKYILVAVDGLDASLTDENNNEDIYVKTSTADVEKKIVSEHDGTTLEDADTVAVGDTVTYQIDATIPTYAVDATGINYQLTDVMSSGLTYKEITSVKVSADGVTWKDATYSTEGSSDANTQGATVKIKLTDDTQIRSNTYVRAVLTATLNESANKGAQGNPNSVDLTYSNNYYGGGDSYTTPEDTVITYTGELNIVKVDAANQNTKLSGAVFDIYRVAVGDEISDDNEKIKIDGVETQVIKVATTAETGTNGKTSVTGLDAGTYYAVETTAPEGYSVDDTPIKLALTVENTEITGWTDTTGEAGSGDKVTNFTATSASDANTSVVTNYPVTWKTGGDTEKAITNEKGLTLPGTGGIGTTIFTFGGLALVILAAALFIVYMKKQKNQA